MVKRLGPLVVVAALVFTLGFSQSAVAISLQEAEDAADLVAGVAIDALTTITEAVNSSSVEWYSAAISLLINKDIALISQRPVSTLLGGGKNKPNGSMEAEALTEALDIGNPVSFVAGNTFTKIFPLFTAEDCDTCHTDYTALGNGAPVGGLRINVDLNQ